MSSLQVDIDLLTQFENGLNERWPERSQIPATVLGYGEISTVLEIDAEGQREFAFKRMPMFNSNEEAEAYEALYKAYIEALQQSIGIQLLPEAIVRLQNNRGRFVAYIAQQKLPAEAIGHKLIHHVSRADIRRLVQAVLHESKKLFDFNAQHQGEIELGFDMQISNWAVVGFDPQRSELPDPIELVYFDTSAPLLRRNGHEQLNPELFLRSAPSFMRWIIRLLFLQDVLTRYYDFRKVAVDLIANFYKEQRPDLVPALVEVVNQFFANEVGQANDEPIGIKEVESYYREDKLIWQVYLTFRKIDRALHRMLRKNYPYILPEKIER